MLNLPEPILGDVNAITIATPDLDASLKFYQQLGFKEVLRLDFPFPWIQVSDGALLIMLRKDPKPYLALTYYTKDIEKSAAIVRDAGIRFTFEPKPGDPMKRYIFQSPDGLNISLIPLFEGFAQPPGPTMLKMAPQDFGNPEKYVNQTIGMFGELAHPVKDINVSIAFWEKLGFKALSRHESPYPWAILSDGKSIVGLHQSTHFDYPAITYFAKNQKENIEKLRSSGMKLEEKMGEANVVATSPEGQRVFLFSL